MFFHRDIERYLKDMAKQFRVLGVVGPRQSGKSTIVKKVFPNYTYVSLENISMRALAAEDPKGFLLSNSGGEGLIIDEAQHVPELFNYLQGLVDEQHRPGFYILTGSHNFLMFEKITQSLAGRIAMIFMLPLSIHEMAKSNLLDDRSMDELIFKGFYPYVYQHEVSVYEFYNQYTLTYIERDVRQVINNVNVIDFQRFLRLCAIRTGNEVNYSDLANDAKISPNTAKAWLSVLAASYIVTILPPYYRNLGKRLTKSPKLYFLDTGLACSLLNIRSPQDLVLHPLKGALVESLVMSELLKNKYNFGLPYDFYFWNEQQKMEIDFLIERSFKDIVPLEVKAGASVMPAAFSNMNTWQGEHNEADKTAYVIYGGDEEFRFKNGTAVPFTKIKELLDSFSPS